MRDFVCNTAWYLLPPLRFEIACSGIQHCILALGPLGRSSVGDRARIASTGGRCGDDSAGWSPEVFVLADEGRLRHRFHGGEGKGVPHSYLWAMAIGLCLVVLLLIELFASVQYAGGRAFLIYLTIGLFAIWQPERRALWLAIAGGCIFLPTYDLDPKVPILIVYAERSLGVAAIWLIASLSMDRKRRDEALRNREEYYRLLVETTDVIPFEMEADSRTVLYVGPQVAVLLGYRPEEWLVPGFWEDHLHNNDRARVVEAFESLVALGVKQELEYRMVNQDQQSRWVRHIATLERVGGRRYLRGFLVEVTATKREQERVRSIIATAMDGFAIIDGVGRLTEVNAAFCAMVGYDRSELMGKPVADLELPTGRETMTVTSEESNEKRIETRFRRRDGIVIDVEVSISSLSNDLSVSFYREITERKRTETALLERKELFRLFIEHAPAAVAMFDRDLRYIVVSRRWLQDYGLEDVEIIGRHHYDIFTNIPERWKEVHARCLGGAVERCEEDSFTGVDGRTEWVRWEVLPWHDEAGSIGGLVIFTEVITGKRRSEERFRRYFELPLVGMAITSPTKSWLEVNDHLCNQLGYERAELMQMTWAQLTHPEDLASDVQQFQSVLAGEIDGYSMEKRFLRKDGGVAYAAMSVYALRKPDKSVDYFVALLQDITDRKQAEAARAETELRFHAIFDQTFDMLGLCRPDGTIVEMNQTALSFTGKQRDEVIGQKLWELSTSLQSDEFHRRFQDQFHAAAAGNFIRYETEFHGSGGSLAIIDLSIKPVHDADGKVAYLIVEARDVTVPKRMEEESRKLEARIQHAQKLESLGVLAGGIAHDFNNLLMGILGNAGLALLDVPAGSTARHSIEQIEVAAQRLAELTNQMLAYSGKGKFVISPLNLSDLVQEMTHLLETVISKRATLKQKFAENLPAVHGDPSQLRQVVMNLITNASDALGEQDGVISIWTGSTMVDEAYASTAFPGQEIPAGQYVFIEVSDNGVGMSKETQSRIFDPFFTTKFTGRGLGLAAVMGIVRGHHGAIRVYSEPGKGTTFKVYLPAADKDLAPTIDPTRSAWDWRGGGKVLVVDDEEVVRDVAERALTRFGFSVVKAHDGREGVERFKENAEEIVAVILDMTMPNMDGEEAFREIRRYRSDARVILSSGYTEQEAIERFAGKGLAGFIQKPYRPLALIEKLKDLLAT